MKIWQGYGSEHSARLVMIGHFATPESAQLALSQMDVLRQRIEQEFDYDAYDSDNLSVYEIQRLRDALSELKLYGFGPDDLEHYMREYSAERKGNMIVVRTDEYDVGGFVKFMIDKSARVEIYSAHDYPERSGEIGATV